MSTTNSLGLYNMAIPAGFIAWNWFYAYGLLSSRTIKQIYGIDHQGSPRQDLSKYGVEAVRSGKLTQERLDQMHRFESASANSVEGFAFFTASLLFAVVARVPEDTISLAGTVYTVGRLVYGAVYVFIADNSWAQIRGIAWWVCNLSCLSLLWTGARHL